MEGYATIEDRFTPEEQAEWNRQYEQEYGSGGTGPVNGGGESGYYDGYMGEPEVQEQGPVQDYTHEPVTDQQPVNETVQPSVPQPSQLWLADPVNFTAIEDKYKDPNYQDEHWSREQIEDLGRYYNTINNGKTRDQWETLREDDPYITKVMMNSADPWWDPGIEKQEEARKNQSAIEKYYTPQTEAEKAMLQDREVKSWDDLKWWEKGLYAFWPGQRDVPLGDAPDWTEKSRNLASAMQSAGAGAVMLKLAGTAAGMLGATGAAAALTNPIVLGAAAIGFGGLLYYQARTGNELPVVNKLAELTDLPDTLTEQVIGTVIQVSDIGKGYVDKANADPNDAYGLISAVNDTVKAVIQNRQSIIDANEYTYEMFGGLGDIVTDAANFLFEGDINGTKLGEAWLFNKGYSEKVKLEEGTYGVEGLATLRGLINNMREQGVSDENIKSLVQHYVIETGGFSSDMSDNLGQMIFDLSMFAPGAENAVVNTLAKATGNETMQQAAQITKASRPIINDMPIVGTIYNGLTGEKSSGGFNETIEVAKNLVRGKDVNQLSAFDRIIAGLDDEGRIKQLLPHERQGLADFLPETQVLGADNIAMNVINSGMSEAQDDVQVHAVLDNYVNGAEGIYNSPDVVTTRDAVAAGAAKTEVYFQRYRDGAEGRTYLKTVADALGMEQKDVITMVADQPDVLIQRMNDVAAKNNGKVGNIDAVNIDNTVTILKGFTGKDPLLWNLNQLKFSVTAALFDEMNEYNIRKYGVKPDGMILQMADTMKSAQSLMLLGLSPSYLINNVINNTVTSIAEGVFGLMTPKQMETMFDEFGVKPARMGESLSEFRGMDGSMSSLDAMNARIAETKQTQGLLSDVRKAIRKVNSKAGVFSNISGKFEELQGKQVTATAINQYWRQTWKAGTGFQAMPEALVNRIEAQNPGMTNLIYMAVERGMNMNDVTKALYGNYIHADAAKVLRETIAEAFPGEPYLYDELFVKSGLLNEVEAAFAMANTEAERAAALDSIRDRTREFARNLKRNELINKAESIQNIAASEGLNAVQNIMADMAINRAETWLLSRDEYNEAYKMIAADKLSGSARASLLSAVDAKNREDWKRQYDYELQVMKGVMNGLGFETETNARYIDTMIKVNESWQEFYQKKAQLIKQVFAEIDRREAAMSSEEIKAGVGSVMRNDVWQNFYDETAALYKEYFQKEMDYQREMDDLLVSGFEKATGKSGDGLKQNLANMRDIRQLMSTMQNEAHEKTRNMTDKEKGKFYAEFDPKYNGLIVELEKLQKANGTIIDNQEGVGYTDNDGVKMTPAQTVKARETVEAADAARAREVRERIGYMSREEIRQGWIDAKRTPAQADMMLAVMQAYIEARTGKKGEAAYEYYGPIFAMKAILDFEENQEAYGTMSDEEYIVRSKQIAQALMNNENFRNFMAQAIDNKDKGTAVYEDGTPKILLHGGAAFGKYGDRYAGSNTGKADSVGRGKMPSPMYLQESWNGARSYRKNDSAYIWSRADQINSDQNLLADLYKQLNKDVFKKDGEIDWKALTIDEQKDLSYDLRNIVRIGDNQVPESLKDTAIASTNRLERGPEQIRNQINTALALAEEVIRDGKKLTAEEIESVAKANVIMRAVVGGNKFVQDKYNDVESQYSKYAGDSNVSTDVGGTSQYGVIHQVVLAAKNPLVVDYNSDEHIQFMMNKEFTGPDGKDVYGDYDNVEGYTHKYTDINVAIAEKNNWDGLWQQYNNQKAWDNGYDAINYRNVIDFEEGSLGKKAGVLINSWVVFEKNLVKNIYNDGRFDLNNKQFLAQDNENTKKGDFYHYDWGNVIHMLEASDVSTMVHKTGHLFRYALSEKLMGDFTTWAGFKDTQEFRMLEYQYWTDAEGFKQRDPKGYQRYVDAEEKFARGFEQYLIDGSAPTVGLKAVFQEFSRFLLSIYQGIKNLAVKDYSRQGEFVFDGPNGREVLNINAEINGKKLRDIFDKMLAGNEIDRVPGYREAVMQRVEDMRMSRTRMSIEAQIRRAQAEINVRVLSKWKSLTEAEAFQKTMKAPIEIDGLAVDDAFLYQVIESAKSDAQMNPFSAAEYHTINGIQTFGYSNTDPNKKYQFRYKVVELNDLQPSNNWMGTQLVSNENYPAELQPRARDSVQSRNQVYNIAANLNPGKIIDDQKSISSGAPTIGEGNMYVEAGNGRILALQYAQQNIPESWKSYQDYLLNAVGDYGIDPAELNGFENPVLVRERMGGDAASFIMDANSRDTLDYSASESAINDANNINMNTLAMLDIQPGEGIDTFTTEKNAKAATEWLRSLPENERAAYMTTNRVGDMVLTLGGKQRFINALFASLYAASDNLNIIKSFSETSDSNIKALESAMKESLPEMTRAEGLIRSGARNASFSIVNDVVVAAGLLQDARKANQNIHDYLAQSVIPGMERWTPTQALLAGFFGDAKNNTRMLRDFFNVYGEEVYKSGDPDQVSLFGESRTKESIIDTAIQAALNNNAKDVMKGSSDPGQSPSGSGLNQVESFGNDFQNMNRRNLQQSFDSGLAVSLEQAEQLNLQGEPDTKYRERFEAKLDEISKANGYSIESRTFAGEYMEWILSDKRGEEPHSANPFIEDNVKADIDDLFSWGGEDLEQLHELHKPGCEVDDTAVPNKGVYVKRVYAFQHGEYTIAANVYVDGEFYGYLPNDLSKMTRTIEDNGINYKVLAIDPNDSRGLVYDDAIVEEVRTVVPGQVDGIEGPEAPKEFIRGSKQGTTPDIMPTGSSYEELYNKFLDPVLEKFKRAYEMAETDARTKNFKGLDLETRALVEKWLDNNVKESMAENKYRAIKYSDMKKDAAMLNYNQRYGFDPILTVLSPYQFWYTRSMWQWAQRMIDKPRWHQMYSRMEELEEKNRNEILPTRLEGKFRIPMPWLPDWMGGGYYIDLNSQLFPFSQFGESYGSNMNQAVLKARTEEILDELELSGVISAVQRQEAKENKTGAVWENAYAQAEREINSSEMKNTLLSQFYSPNIFVSWYNKVRAGEDPGRFSSTRTGNALKTLTSGTGLEGIGGAIGDAMTLPERAMRKLYGIEYDEFGSYGDQQIRKQIAQMCADGEITDTQALNAMNEKSGTIWEMAADRQRKENELRVPLFASAEAIKSYTKGEASIGDVIGALGASLLGGQFFPTGEQELRRMKSSKDQAYVDKANGDKAAVANWYNANPAYSTYSAVYMSDPEDLLKYTLYQNITKNYYAEPYERQRDLANQMGAEFRAAIVNSETRNYKAVPTGTLAKWNAQLGGTNPNIGSIDVKGVERVLRMSDRAANVVKEYNDTINTKYASAKIYEDMYYELPKDQRKAFLNQVPELKEYWEYKAEAKAAHPEIQQWIDDRSEAYNEDRCYNSFAEMSPYTQKALEYSSATGNAMSETADYELKRLYAKYGVGYMTYEEYVKLLRDYR